MTLRSDNHTLPKPDEARTVKFTPDVTCHINLARLFGTGNLNNWNEGDMYTLQVNAPFYVLSDDTEDSEIDPTLAVDLTEDSASASVSVSEDEDSAYPDVSPLMAPLLAADTQHRVFIAADRNYLHLHVQDGVGVPDPLLAQIWVSSKLI